MNAYIFPGQGAQFVGMGLDLYEKYPVAKELFENRTRITQQSREVKLEQNECP